MAQCSVIISFYNKIEYLKLVLAGFERQSFKDFEVIIADDGSKEDIVQQIKHLQNNYFSPLPIFGIPIRVSERMKF
jgi:glycosyltransferase involved in cell wall biosynthesis